jgi:methylenetetrahydrofolate dehydrogenase (NADP+)/methenyltetrahydrofolate cyclohydrolase
VTSPIAHAAFVDLALENDRAAGKNGREDRNPAKSHFAMARRIVEAFEQSAIAVQHFGTATCNARRHVVRLHETIECALELVGGKASVELNFATDAFQGVSLLRQTNGDGVPARILDGKALAAELRTELLARTSALRNAGIHPKLVIVFVGENESSRAYVRNLAKTGERCGVDVVVDRLPEHARLGDVRADLERLAHEPSVHGVMLQQPLPAHLPIRQIADAIPPHKDADGSHPMNQGHLAFGSGTEYIPATPAAIMLLLERSPHWPLRGKRALMVGRSIVVGAPVALLMLAQDATVTVVHRESGPLRPFLRDADVVVVATGVPGLIRGEDLKPGSTVIDVGTTIVDGALRGDVDFESAVTVAGAVTPVPGGVGPVTNVALLRNVVKSAERMSVVAL